MTDLSELKLFSTYPHDCSYLEDEEATTLFVDPHAKLDGQTFSQLSELGFRRSGAQVYRPQCAKCHACVPIRVMTKLFSPTRSQKRCLKRNQDVHVNIVDTIDTDEHFALYEKYLAKRHSDGDMYPPTRKQYREFLSHEWGITRYLEYRTDEKLIAVSVTDQLEGGISAIYAFFDPEEEKRSLGVFNVLYLISFAKEIGLSYIYLGYWIRNCRKMRYKVEYRPFQLFIDNSWIMVSDYREEKAPS